MSMEARLKKAAAALQDAPEIDITERAEYEGLVDIAFATVDSPFGTFVVAMTNKGLVRLALAPTRVDDVLAELSARVSPRIFEMPGRIDPVRRELDEYFAGRRWAFDVAIDWSLSSGFNSRVLHATARIPYGEVSSYGKVAAKAGSPRAARAAGNALHNNPIAIVVPCHRVVGANGSLTGYGGGLERKEMLLRLEGATL